MKNYFCHWESWVFQFFLLLNSADLQSITKIAQMKTYNDAVVLVSLGFFFLC